jgi:AraC-like DNA-binding protein
MLTYITHIQLTSGLLSLLLATQFLLMSAIQPLLKRLLALNYLLYAHQSLWLVAILNGQLTAFSLLRPIGAMFLGPLLYLYFCYVQKPYPKFKKRDLLHFAAALILVFVFNSTELSNDWFEHLIIASFLLYFLLIVLKMRQGKDQLQHLGDFALPAYRWLLFLLLIALINVLAEIAVAVELQQGVRLQDSVTLLLTSCCFLMLNITAMLAVLNRSHWLEWMYQFGQQVSVKPLPTADLKQATLLLQRFDILIENENLHKLEFGITLPQAAKKLQIPARHLSNAINQLYGKSYSVYLNEKRIDEAKRLLRKQPQMPVTEVMLQAGFSSKSNFNKEFLRSVGLSPSAYRDAEQQK